MKTAQAGTLESMDCVVSLTEGTAGSGMTVTLSGASAARFGKTMEKTVLETLRQMGAVDAVANVQDNGALDIVLAARVEAAWKRLTGGDRS
ncbi:citrate lyase acyl carrier protein [Aminithiophilus ramosus]|uniref:Citrate lyase acyl carrier protein n=2 Tax=Synergistales TaxID=649776 RepID=A0A9Q7ARH5_9BACT|nr:citrate lyase acyl carrier protein [Aminithiophilus ramosus]QTX33422.1 citrate lyase acyl carrier protein [Aminithiophilus ramosus]QVL36831.1 citrate lyase acyl carrier protein [Synergistota bacterium]